MCSEDQETAGIRKTQCSLLVSASMAKIRTARVIA